MGRKNKGRSQKPSQKKSSVTNMAIPSARLRSALQQGMALLQSGRLQEAERVFQSALEIDPKNVNALRFLSVILFQTGRLRDGEKLLRRAIKHNPKMADLHYNHGMMLDRLGKLELAVAAYRKALTLGASNEWVHNNLGIVLSKMDRIEEAEASIKKALNINPNNPSALSNLGLILWKSDRLEEAYKVLDQALDIDPKCVDALTNMGNICLSKVEIDEAEGYLRRAMDIDPKNFNAVNNLAVTLLHKGEYDESLAMIRKALELNPESADAMITMAKVHTKKDDEKEAESTYHRVLEMNPDNSDALVLLARIYSKQGRFDVAKKHFQKALRISPEMIGARVGLVEMDPPGIEDKEIKGLEDAYQSAETSEDDKTLIAFCLGKAFEKAGVYKQAFNYLADGNGLKRSSYEYSLEDDIKLFTKIKEVFSKNFFKEHSDSGCNDKTPIFILGMPRSGTTLTEQILSSHTQVFGAGELPDLKYLLSDKCGTQGYWMFPELSGSFSSDDFNQMGVDYVERLKTRDNTAERVTDKMPHNFLHVGMIRLMLPNAKIIHCRRNPVDNCLSIFKQNFSGVHKYAHNLNELGGYYLLYRDLMEHWQNALPGFMFELQYEDMVSDQEGMTRKLLEFCDLPWDDNCLQFHKSERTVKTASYTQVRRKIYSDSVELWKRYEQQLQPLISALAGDGA